MRILVALSIVAALSGAAWAQTQASPTVSPTGVASAPLGATVLGDVISEMRVIWEGRVIRGVDAVSEIGSTSNSGIGPVVLERPLTQDKAFEIWAAQDLRDLGAGGSSESKDVRVEFWSRTKKIVAYDLRTCNVIAYVVRPSLRDGGASPREAMSFVCLRMDVER